MLTYYPRDLESLTIVAREQSRAYAEWAGERQEVAMTEGQQQEDLGRSWGHTASDAFHASAAYFRSLPDEAWSGPTGCADWDERTLGSHILGEAVWFPNMLKGTTKGEPAHPGTLYDEMKAWTLDRQNSRLDEAADELRAAVDEAISQHAQETLDLGWTKVPLWQSTYVILMESVYHDWDTRAGRDPQTTIPTPWAVELAKAIDFSAPLIAHHDAVEGASGRYLLQVGDGVGPITIVTEGDELTAEKGAHGTPDVTLHLTADQCVRLVAGRFSVVGRVERGEVRAEGDRRRVEGFTRIFGGIANG
jgi:uncharacterized protein (TIGR03083 family)